VFVGYRLGVEQVPTADTGEVVVWTWRTRDHYFRVTQGAGALPRVVSDPREFRQHRLVFIEVLEDHRTSFSGRPVTGLLWR
jgi:hypothetical protein